MTVLTKEEIEEGIKRLSPWNHEIELPHGLWTRSPDEPRPRGIPRVKEIVSHAFPSLLNACGGSLEGLRVLDVACNNGGVSIEAAKQGANFVLGVDIVEKYIQQARFVKAALGYENVEFEQTSVYDIDAKDIGKFDVTLCLGLLYHLENPVLAMRKVGAVTRHIMVVDTQILPTPEDPKPLWHMAPARKAQLTDDPQKAQWNLYKDQDYLRFKPNQSAVRRLLKFLGFEKIRIIKPVAEKGLGKKYYEGQRATFLAVREA